MTEWGCNRGRRAVNEKAESSSGAVEAGHGARYWLLVVAVLAKEMLVGVGGGR